MVSMCILHSLCAVFDVVFNPGAIFAIFVFVQLSFSFPSPRHLCVSIRRFQLDGSLCPLFLLVSLSLPLSFSGRLQRNWSLGGSREEPGKGGTKGRPSAAITTPHLLSPPFFPPLVPSPLFPLSTGQRPKLRLQTRKWAH